MRGEARRLFFAVVLLVCGLLAVRSGDSGFVRVAGALGIGVAVIFLAIVAAKLPRRL